ncbi:MAG: hydrogenase maturation nickel metallochaperone HypA [Planctomycetes bacterium]|nr:hydrogenase maturation nickel metallochaperone HypA [Planctomycetota bacterium]
MHELSLMKSLMRKVDEVADREGAGRVLGVKVWLGALSHFSPSHFEEHFVQAATGTRAEGARLDCVLSDDIGHPHAQDVLIESVLVDRDGQG